MDGLKMVIPGTCGDREVTEELTAQLCLFDEPKEPVTKIKPCPGCKNNDVHTHNGIQCKIREWFTDKGNTIDIEKGIIPFHTLIGKIK